MARTAKPKIDPLLAALIEKLPAGGTAWPHDKRAAWLDNMARAFDTVYEGARYSDERRDVANNYSWAKPSTVAGERKIDLSPRGQVAAARAEPQILDLNRAYVEVPPATPPNGATRAVQALGDDGKMHAATVPVPPPRPPHDFYIDGEGFARRSAGHDRIMPGHVTSAIFDMRGESGDPGAIVWADDSRGVRGLRLDISAG